jgi:hypothetical protein
MARPHVAVEVDCIMIWSTAANSRQRVVPQIKVMSWELKPGIFYVRTLRNAVPGVYKKKPSRNDIPNLFPDLGIINITPL